MSKTIKVCCKSCGHEFERTYGVDVMGRATLYCRTCGRSQNIDLSLGWMPLDACECGGVFDAEALGACPNCGSLELKF